jgi:hypothetical protein
MAGKRRSKTAGHGMTPLFDLAGYQRPDEQHSARSPRRSTEQHPQSFAPTPVPYWIRGVFRFASGEERTRSVTGQAMSDRRDADIATFIDHLREEGWLFPEGRAVMVNLLGIGAEDGGAIFLTRADER